MKTMLAKTLVSCMAVLLCFSSCSDKKEESGKTEALPPSEYEESSLPDGFVFPGESPIPNDISLPEGMTDTQTYTKKAMSVAAYISENADLSGFEEYTNEKEGSCTIDYIRAKDTDIPARNLTADITIGTEKLAISFPTNATELLEKGFTWINQNDSETTLEPDDILTLCTPEEKEIFGFVVGNSTPVTASEADISGMMLTSYNNFTTSFGITGSTKIGEALNLAGLPDMISINATFEGTSVILEYADAESGVSVTIFADGDTGDIIAVYLMGNKA